MSLPKEERASRRPRGHGFFQLPGFGDCAHTAASTSEGGLDEDGIAYLLGPSG